MDFSVSDAKTLFTAITELIKKGANLEAEQKLVELREAVLDLQSANLELREKISELEQQLTLRDNIKYENQYYWVTPKVGNKEGPYCQLCYDNEGKLIRLQQGSDRRESWYQCFKCKSYFDIK